MLANLLPYWILQPWVDAAFKKRGIDPENFWRSAGLPAFRFPDPNGTRFPNGAPPPAPPVLEGTPDHPGPGGGAGIAVLVRAAAGTVAAAGQPDAVCGCRPKPGSVRTESGRIPALARRAPRRRRTLTVCRRRRESRSPGGRGSRHPTCRAHRCRCRTRRRPGRAPSRWDRPGPAPAIPPRRSRRDRCPPDPPAPPGPGNNLPAPYIGNTGGAGGSGAQGGNQN